MRTAVVSLLVAAFAVLAPSAMAKPVPIKVTAVSSPPVAVSQGIVFDVSGAVLNRTPKQRSVTVRLRLRRGSTIYSLGDLRLRRVKPGRRTFSTSVQLADAPVPQVQGYALRACVRGASRRSCTGALGTAFVAEPAVAATPIADVTAVPTAAATATETATATDTPSSTPTDTPPVTTTPDQPPVNTPATPANPPFGSPGARSGGDTLFPDIGNGGYDAIKYDLNFDYVPATKVLNATSTATLKATQDLSEFSFDLAPWLTVTRVTVDGVAATFSRNATKDTSDQNQKLIITPPAGIPDGTTFSVAVAYNGTQQAVKDPDGSSEGWVPNTRGAIVVSEPIGAMGVFPCNNVPYDKATFSLTMTVPDDSVSAKPPWTVVATGARVGQDTTSGGKRTSTWVEPEQTSTYLFGLGVGHFDTAESMVTIAPGKSVPLYYAVDTSFADKPAINAIIADTPNTLAYYADYYGVQYPFNAMGAVVPRANVSYSLEVQTKPFYPIAPNSNVPVSLSAALPVSHENGHMYFGDYATLGRWKDIWINEGMTEFSSLLYQERKKNGPTLSSFYAQNYTLSAKPDFWLIAPADPQTSEDIFDSDAMYERGALTTYGVQQILGETDFRDMMNDYLLAHAYSSSSTEDFITQVKASDLEDQTAAGLPDRTARWTEFFKQWLYTSYTGTNKPAMTKDNFDAYTLP